MTHGRSWFFAGRPDSDHTPARLWRGPVGHGRTELCPAGPSLSFFNLLVLVLVLVPIPVLVLVHIPVLVLALVLFAPP